MSFVKDGEIMERIRRSIKYTFNKRPWNNPNDDIDVTEELSEELQLLDKMYHKWLFRDPT